MKTIKKLLAAILAIIIITTGVAPLIPPAAAVQSYWDISGHWAREDILRINELGALADFDTGDFRPDAPITRAEFFSLVVRVLGATVRGDISRFTDVTRGDWYYDIVAIAVNMGIANGYEDNTMRPNNNLTRQDAATLAARALGMSSRNEDVVTHFSDFLSISYYAKTYIASFAERGLMNGYPDGTLRPQKAITRAEAVRLISNLFPNIHLPEPTYHNVSLRGGLLVNTPGSELRDVVLYGDVIVGDGVGSGSVLISNCTIFGNVVVRGGGPNSVTLSNTYVDGIYVASFGADTRVAVTDDSVVPEIGAVSSFTLSGRGITDLTILDDAREGAVVKLDGVSLDNLHIGGRASKVTMTSGRVLYARFDGAGQGATLDISLDSSVENLTVAAPNATVTGKGRIRNLLVNNTGAKIEENPEFTTVGVNFSATISGSLVNGPESTAPNVVDRVNNPSRYITLLDEPALDQGALRIQTIMGRSATEINVTQMTSGRVPLTRRVNRLAYWVGFFVPAPGTTAPASLTYTYVDGDPITLRNIPLVTRNGVTGLIVYLPVFKLSGTDTGLINEALYINWGGEINENLQFRSPILQLRPLAASQKTELEADFIGLHNDSRGSRFYSINGVTTYYGAEAVRRILSSDNPLGLPSTNNKALDAINYALTPSEVRSILQEETFAAELGVNTSLNSAYAKLSGTGKAYVADAVLAARKSSFATPAAVKAAFDKAVDARLAAESALLTKINGSGDPAALRKLIETAANAALLDFQTGADPYKSFTNADKDAMAKYLFDMIEYTSLEAVIRAIKDYLNQNSTPGTPSLEDYVINSIAASPNTLTMAMGNKREVKLTVNTNKGVMPAADVARLVTWQWARTGQYSPLSDVTIIGDTLIFNANQPGQNDRLNVSAGGKTVAITVNVTPGTPATSIKLSKNTVKLIAVPREADGTMVSPPPMNSYERLTYTITPSNSTDDLRWDSDNEAVATVVGGVVTGVGRGRALVTVESMRDPGVFDTCEVWVFADENDIIITPELVTLGVGSTYQVKYEMYRAIPSGGNIALVWKEENAAIATVSGTGMVRAVGTQTDTAGNVINSTVVSVEVWVAGNPPADPTKSGMASIKVIVENRQSLRIDLKGYTSGSNDADSAVMYQGDRRGLDATRLRDPVTNEQILPYAPGQQFIWEIVRGTSVKFIVNGSVTSSTSVTLNTSVMPGIQATGIGRSYISIRTSPGEQPIHTIEVVSVPRGVQNMEFYEGSVSAGNLISNKDNYGRVLEMKNNETQQVIATEQNDTGRLMTWRTLEVDQFRNLGRVTAPAFQGNYNSDGSVKVYDASGYTWYMQYLATAAATPGALIEKDSSLVLAPGGRVTPQHNKTGLAAVRVTPVRDADTEKEVLPGAGTFLWVDYWYATVPLFVPDGGSMRINPVITEQSHFMLQAKDASGNWVWVKATSTDYFCGIVLEDPSLDTTAGLYANFSTASGTTVNTMAEIIACIEAGDARVTDANGVPLTTATTSNPQVNAAVDLANFDGSNVFYVWVTPKDVDIVQKAMTTTVIPWYWDIDTVPFMVTLDASVIPGSNDLRNDEDLWWRDDPLPLPPGAKYHPPDDIYEYYIITHASQLNERTYMSLYPQTKTVTGSAAIDIQGIRRFGNAYSAFAVADFSHTGGPYTMTVSVVQIGNQGFAPVNPENGNNIGRKPPIPSDKELSVTFSITAEPKPPAVTTPSIIIYSLDTEFDLKTDSEVKAAAAGAGIDLNNATYTVTSTTSPGSIQFTAAGVIKMTAPAYGFVRVNQGSSSIYVEINGMFATSPPPPPPAPAPVAPGSAPFSVGMTVPTAEIDGVQAAAFDAGIDLYSAVFESETPAVVTIDGAGNATAHRAGRAKLTVRTKDWSKSTEVVVDVMPSEGGSFGTQPAGAAATGPGPNSATGGSAEASAGGAATIDPEAHLASLVESSTGSGSSTDPGATEDWSQDPQQGAVSDLTAVKLRATAGVAVGGSMTLIPFVTPYNTDRSALKWSSSNEGVATVSAGVVTGVSAGTAVITVTDASGTLKASCTVTAKAETAPVESIAVNKTTLALNVGASSALTVTYKPTVPSIKGVSWRSSNETVARVDPTGKVIGVAEGVAIITAISDSGALTASCTVNVKIPVTSITLPEAKIVLKPGETFQLSPTVNPGDATDKALSYAVKSTTIATVTETGLLTALKPGTTIVTIKADGKTATCTIVVKN